tara:strand:- start:27 stop:194 length:168 start_codon:yes stop_codon:yes gene_type:complete
MCQLSTNSINTKDFEKISNTQKAILEVLTKEFEIILKKVISTNSYDFITEYRTFK